MRLSAGAVLALAVATVPSEKVVPVPARAQVDSVALVGSQVAWSDQAVRPVVRLDRKVVWRAWKVPIPADAASSPFYDAGIVQGARVVAGSARRLAVLHAANPVLDPKCRKSNPPCMAPTSIQPLLGEVWVGPPRGPFRRVSGAPRSCPQRAIAVAVDASGGNVLVADRLPACEAATASINRITLIRPGRGRRVLRSSRALVFRAAALAGRYAAWTEESTDVHGGPRVFSLVVYDLRRRREAYRLGPPEVRIDTLPQLDVQPDGTVAFIAGPRGAACDGTLGWASRARPTPRFLPVNAIGPPIAASNRVLFASRSSCTSPEAPRLVVAALRGGVRTVARPPELGAVDFDGRRLAFVGEADGRPAIIVRPVRR